MLPRSSDFLVPSSLEGFALPNEIHGVISNLEGGKADPAHECSTAVNGIRITVLGCFVSFVFNLQFRTMLFNCTSFI